jgi:hypothetical protein
MNASVAIGDTEQLKSRESSEAFYSRAKINRMALDLASAVATHLPGGYPVGRWAGSPLSPSAYYFKYASVPHGSARPSRDATGRFRDEPSWIVRAKPRPPRRQRLMGGMIA